MAKHPQDHARRARSLVVALVFAFAGLAALVTSTAPVVNAEAAPIASYQTPAAAPAMPKTGAELLALAPGAYLLQHQLDLRVKLGLPIDATSLDRAITEWRARPADAPGRDLDPQIPLSDAEWNQYLAWNQASQSLGTLNVLLEENRLWTLGAYMETDITDLTVIVNVTASASGELIKEIQSVIAPPASLDLRIVQFNSDEQKALVTELQADLEASKVGNPGGAFTDLAIAGYPIVYLGWNPQSPEINLVVDRERAVTQALPAAALDGIVTEAKPGLSSLEVNFEMGSVAIETSSRESDPGQIKAGVEILIGAIPGERSICTVAGSVQNWSGIYLLTAAHCDNGVDGSGPEGAPDLPVFHHGNQIGTTTTLQIHNLAAGQDFMLILLSPGGYASEYFLRMPIYDPTLEYHDPIDSAAFGPAAPIPGSMVCMEGASPYRDSLNPGDDDRQYTLCGLVIDQDLGGFVRVDSPVCTGDSGGLIRYGRTPYGLNHSATGNPIGEGCASQFTYSRMDWALNDLQVNLFRRSSPSDTTPETSTPIKEQLAPQKCLDGNWASAYYSGISMYKWTCQTNEPQFWSMVPVANDPTADLYEIRRAALPTACLEVKNSGNKNGTAVVQKTCTGAANQRWRLEDQNGGWFQMYAVNTTSQCLDMTPTTTNGTNAQTWSCNGNAQQKFHLSF